MMKRIPVPDGPGIVKLMAVDACWVRNARTAPMPRIGSTIIAVDRHRMTTAMPRRASIIQSGAALTSAQMSS